MNKVFCAVCRHPLPGHQPWCPVLTQEPQRGILNLQAQAFPQVEGNQMGQIGRAQAGWVIWSEEHLAWWCPAQNGYTRFLAQAGRYPQEQAQEIVLRANRYCVPPEWHECALPDPMFEMAQMSFPDADVVCECGAKCDPMDAGWRWDGKHWQHHHGYPIGHVIVLRPEEKENYGGIL